MKNAKFEIVRITRDDVVIRDVGHDHGCLSVTNDVERVVAWLHTYEHLGDRRLTYYDSEEVLDEILHENGRFCGFSSVSFGTGPE
jgi:hypothetical protein